MRTCAPGQPYIAQIKEFPGQQTLKIYLPKIFIGAKRVLRFLGGRLNFGSFKSAGIKPCLGNRFDPAVRTQLNPGQGAWLLSRVR